MATYTLTGRLINKETREGLAGLRVEASGRIANADKQLGMTATDADGKFVLEFKIPDRALKRKPLGVIKIFSNAALLHISTAQPIADWVGQQAALVIELEPLSPQSGGDTDVPAARQFFVMGKVHGQDGRPLPGLFIGVFDKGIGTDKQLNVGETDAHGEYNIRYTQADMRQNGDGNANLFVCVHTARDGGEILAESSMVPAATASEVINLMIPANVYAGMSLFELVQHNVNGVAGEINPETVNAKDVELSGNRVRS